MKKSQKLLIGSIVIFFVFNILNTYFITTELLNKYITVFTRGFWSELNAIIGNIAALSILLFIGFLFIKRTKSRLLYLTIITGVLNIAVFASGVFTKYYQTVFSFTETRLFKNPAQELASSIFGEALKELIVYYRIIVFAPLIIMIVYYFFVKRHYKKNELNFKENMPLFSMRMLSGFMLIGSFVVSVGTLSLYNITVNASWPIFAERPLYGVQTAGLYNYYLGQALGFSFEENKIVEIDLRTYDEYNRNTKSYENLYGENYGNILYKEDVELDFNLHPHLINDSLNGIFKDKNLVLIHLESFNHFLLNEEGPYLDETYYKTLKKILKESYVLDNFYTNVGLGNSCDAEFSVNTGIYPQGHTTLYWEYENTKYEFAALPKLFEDYYKVSLHGDIGSFYNRIDVHENMLGFDDYHYFDNKEEYFEGTKNGYWVFPENTNTNLPNQTWLTESDLLSWLKISYDKTSKTLGKKGFYYPMTMQPHTPFEFNPTKEEDLRFKPEDINISDTTLRYLNYETYTEDFFKQFIDLTHEMKDTIFIFYSDHGSNIDQRDYETLFNIETTSLNSRENNLKYHQEMIKTLAFIYAPDDTDNTTGVKRGLLKGVQPRVRSQVDLYRTIIELFGLETNHYYFGVNALSKEHTFSIDTRNFSIVTDDYYMMGKKMTNEDKIDKSYISLNENPKLDPIETFKYIFKFKAKMDRAIQENAFQYLKT